MAAAASASAAGEREASRDLRRALDQSRDSLARSHEALDREKHQRSTLLGELDGVRGSLARAMEELDAERARADKAAAVAEQLSHQVRISEEESLALRSENERLARACAFGVGARAGGGAAMTHCFPRC